MRWARSTVAHAQSVFSRWYCAGLKVFDPCLTAVSFKHDKYVIGLEKHEGWRGERSIPPRSAATSSRRTAALSYVKSLLQVLRSKPPNPFEYVLDILLCELIEMSVIGIVPNVRESGNVFLRQGIVDGGLC